MAETLPPPEAERTERVRDLELLVQPRPAGGLVHASLFLEVGAAFVDPPAVAALAAMAVERPGLEARATHDRIELRVRGTAAQLPAMLARLAEALADRDLDDHAELRARLDDTRRRAYADPVRRADLLALRAHLGAGADALAGDPSLEDVRAFQSVAFGTRHALLVVAGEVEAAEVRALVASAFEGAPRGSPYGGRAPELPQDAAPVERSGDRNHFTVAATRWSMAEALALAEWLGPSATSVQVYPHARGVTVLARARRPEDATRLQRDAALAPPGEQAEGAGSLEAQVALASAMWRRQNPPTGVAFGGVCAESARACPGAREVEDVDVTIDGPRATLRAANGVQVVAEQRPGDEAVALHVVTGGVAHGDTVLAAHALGAMCDRVEARVQPEGFTLVARGEWTGAMARAARCLLDMAPVPDRLPLVAALRRRPARAWIAAALAPGAQARVAPEGTSEDVAAARAPAEVLGALRRGRRLRVGVVTRSDPGVAARRAHAWFADLPAGDEAARAEWEAPRPIEPRDWRRENVRMVVGWRSEVGDAGADAVGRAIATGLEHALAPHGVVVWHNGGGGAWGAWAAVALDVDAEHVDAVATFARALRPTETDVARHHAEEVARARWAGADAAIAAGRLARTGRSDPAITSTEALPAIVRGLGAPSFVIARPQEPNALRRSRVRVRRRR